MSYTLHWSNFTADNWRDGKKFQDQEIYDSHTVKRTAFDYLEKIGSLTPAISLQEDVLFPNALAGSKQSKDLCSAVGCKGHQVDNEFPLELSTPTCIPLVQYPTVVNTKSTSLDEQDMCRIPVLNWESYATELRYSLNKVVSTPKINDGQVLRRAQSSKINPQHGQSEDERLEGEDEEYDDDPLNHVTKLQNKSKFTPKPTMVPQQELVTELFKTGINMEKLDEAVVAVTTERRKFKEEVKKKFTLPRPKLKAVRAPFEISLSTLRRYKNVPNIKVKGTWNFLYNHKGACEWTNDTMSKDSRMLLVGKGPNLRGVRLKKSNPASMISYAVSEVWDEERPPTKAQPDTQEFLDDLIFQITAHRAESFAGVRRGTTIDLYNTSDTPSYLSSVPLRGYSRERYAGYSKHDLDTNLKFTTFDLNPYNPCELVTLDQNYIIQHHDVVAEKSSNGVYAMDSNLFNMVPIPLADRHDFTLNQASGLTFANDTSTLYFYYDSKVYFYDRRKLKIGGIQERPDFHLLLDLGNATSSMAISDQRYFSTFTKNKMQEYISCVQRSHNPTYYYVGTSYRIYLMDWRVPNNPVIKLSHGLKSPISYIDTNYNKNFEVVVAGTQRGSEIFSAVLDYAHVSCQGRTECRARNPILMSYPRHLSNSRDFLTSTVKGGYQFAWESENHRVEEHCHAWCTGLSLCTLPGFSRSNKVPGCGVVSTNNYGDVFYQEWASKPLEPHRIYSSSDFKWTNFLGKWKQNMSSTCLDECRPPLEPMDNEPLFPDCSSLIESTTVSREDLEKVEDFSFDPFTLDPNQNGTKNVKSIEENAKPLTKFKGARARKLVEVWKEDWKCKTPLFREVSVVVGTDDNDENDDDGGLEETTLNPTDSWQEKNIDVGQTKRDIEEDVDMSKIEIKQEIEDIYENGDFSDVEIISDSESNLYINPFGELQPMGQGNWLTCDVDLQMDSSSQNVASSSYYTLD